ncbi:MAG: tRNA uridine-5-carboxymethylaminomethyl(34) synthesis GTPase MnmE [Opitutales bacterium]|nr:tRNA uridine-5-carboxymethylaminomethyl(34) synthesis GTPase MnmE [Opitutales bacterium]
MVRLTGPSVFEIASGSLGWTERRGVRKNVYASYQDVENEVLDDVVYSAYGGPASYTGQDMLEISCHGSPFIARKILDDCVARGCRLAEPGEFTQRAFHFGKMDLSQAEAVIELIHARSEAARKVALRQVGGGVTRLVSELTEELLGILAHLEAYIDFPEEDLPTEDTAAPPARIVSLREKVGTLSKTSRYRSLFTEGIQTAFVGSPNAGKSSLLNAFLGEERALVSDIAGTTRDYIREQFNLGPFNIQILDTAGLRDQSNDTIEEMGMRRTIEQASRADCILWVIDGDRPDWSLPDQHPDIFSSQFCYALINKADLETPVVPEGIQQSFKLFSVSAVSGAGLDTFQAAWLNDLESSLPDLSSQSVIVSARHSEALDTASVSLTAAHAKLLNQEPTELAVSDLREALEAFGRIIGEVDNERMLDQLFKTFCIGK